MLNNLINNHIDIYLKVFTFLLFPLHQTMNTNKRKRSPKKRPPDKKVKSTPKKKQKQDNEIVECVENESKARLRPDVEKRLKDRQDLETFTIKNGWVSLKPNPIVQIGLNHLLPVVHQASIEGALLAQTVILRCLREDIQLPELNQTFFYRCMVQVTRNNEREKCPIPCQKDTCIEEGFKEYKTMRSTGITWPLKNNCTQALNYAGKDYLTACKNHVVMNFYGRLKKYWQRSLMGCIFKKDKMQGQLQRWLIQLLLSGEKVTQEEWDEKMNQAFFVERPDDALICFCSFNDIRCVLDDAGVFPITVKTISTKWQQLLKPLYWMRQHVDTCPTNTRQKANDDGSEMVIDEHPQLKIKPTGKCFRTFSLLPIPSLDAKYMTIDERVLNDLWMMGNKIANVSKAKKEKVSDPDDKYEIWKKSFLGLKLKNVSGSRYFDCRIQTDGMGASLTWRRPKVEKETVAPISSKMDDYIGPDPKLRKSNPIQPTMNNCNVPEITYTAIDPGRSEFIVAVRKDESIPYLQVRSKAWYGPEYINSKKRRTKKLTKYTPNVHTIPSNEIPSLKTIEKEEWKTGILYITSVLNNALRYYGSRGCKRLRWGGYIATQKALIKLVNELACESRDTDIAFGNWGNASGLATGHRSGPVKALTRELQKDSRFRVHIIDEYCSSKLCCRCDQELFAPKDKNLAAIAKAKGEKVKSIWGMRVCKHCDITWNRNTNAAHNILRARFDTERPSRLRSEAYGHSEARAKQREEQNQGDDEPEEPDPQTESITQNISTSGDVVSELVEVDTNSTYT